MAKVPYTTEYVGTCARYRANAFLASSRPMATKAPPTSAWLQRTWVLGT